MKNWLIALAAASTLMALSPQGFSAARADEIAGTIQSVDQSNGTFILDDGKEFLLADDIGWDELAIGTEVLVTYERSASGTLLATALELMN